HKSLISLRFSGFSCRGGWATLSQHTASLFHRVPFISRADKDGDLGCSLPRVLTMFEARVTLRIFFSAILFVLACGGLAQAGRTNVAVAANFTDAANEIARVFAKESGHEAVLSFGATGQLYAQITQGAPFEVFL